MKEKILGCKVCGFPIEYRPNLYSKDGICGACLNLEIKKTINFQERQEWLNKHLAKTQNKNSQYDCVIGVSGGKDSHMIVKRLMENHNIKNPLLVTTYDECTHTKAGEHNIKNIAQFFDCDHIIFRYKPQTNKKEMLECFTKYLNPYMKAEIRLGGFDGIVMKMAKMFGVRNAFFGENADFEYGSTKELNILHKNSNKDINLIYMGAIYPYGYMDSLNEAKSVGFKDLDDFKEWNRRGSVENFAQIDSIGYMAQYWCKYVKFGAQRTTDMATRLVREGVYTREQALIYINEFDHILDPFTKRDICDIMSISGKKFDEIVDSHANTKIVYKDANGAWRRIKEVI